MTLREQLHESIDQLDDDALALIQAQLHALRPQSAPEEGVKRVPTLDEVLEMTSSDRSCWSEELIAERNGRM